MRNFRMVRILSTQTILKKSSGVG